jgi:hypothetical protein
LRSARAVRVGRVVVLPVMAEPVPDVPEDIVEPLLVEPVVPVVPEDMLPLVEPVEAEPEVLPVAAPPPGVPVVPIGVPCVLRWPAPTAGFEAGAGGALWAKAREAASTAEAAIRVLVVADIFRISCLLCWTGELPAKQD